MAVQYRCDRGERWLKVQEHASIKGIDYLEVSENQHELLVYFIPKMNGQVTLPLGITSENIRITIGPADSGIRVTDIQRDTSLNRLVITVDDGQGNDKRIGDFSRYTFELIDVPDIDPLFSKTDFSFRINCPGTLDCKPSVFCPKDPASSPRIDYLSKDYAGFRQLMLDRLSLILPDWKERSPADATMVLVELLR